MFGFLRIRWVLPALAIAIAAATLACDLESDEVAKEVVREPTVSVEGTPGPQAGPVTAAGPPVYQMGLFAEPITRNYWNYVGGPGGSVWTGYVLAGYASSLYGYSDQRFDWVPVIAADFPTDLKKETIDGTEYWTAEVPLKTGIQWSDGEELTAEDFVFTVNTVLDMELGSGWAEAVDSAFVERVEALDSHRLKVIFKATDDEGNPQTPGLSVWQFGLAFMPIMPEHYWASVVEEAKKASDTAKRIEALFAHVPEGEPTVNGFTFRKWEPGAFFENEAVANFYQKGAVVTQYANGALMEANERLGYTTTYFGEASGEKVLGVPGRAARGQRDIQYLRQPGCCGARVDQGRCRLPVQSSGAGKGLSGSYQERRRSPDRLQRRQRGLLSRLQRPQGAHEHQGVPAGRRDAH